MERWRSNSSTVLAVNQVLLERATVKDAQVPGNPLQYPALGFAERFGGADETSSLALPHEAESREKTSGQEKA